MRLIYSDDRTLPTRDQISQAYGIKNPEKISGYEGFFFKLLDIYAVGKLERDLDNNPLLINELLEMVTKYKKCEYGAVTPQEEDNNLENRYLCGSSVWTIARYGTCKGETIFLNFRRNNGYMYYCDDFTVGEMIAEKEDNQDSHKK